MNTNPEPPGQSSRRLVKAPGESARHLADLRSLSLDLRFCADCCDRLLELEASKKSDLVLEEALWSAALISYFRCFNAGRRSGLSDKLFEDEDPLAAKLHWHFREMRSKFVAHSVSPFEQLETGLVLDTAHGSEKVVGTLVINARRQLDIPTEATNLKSLVFLIHRSLEDVARKVESETMEAAKLLSQSELSALPACVYIHPGWEQSGDIRA